jgi:sulfatase modifying factor 1
MKLCWCPAGSFTMGSPAGEPDRSNDEDQVEVTLTRGFWMGKYAITQGEYEKIMGRNPSHFSPSGEGRSYVKGMDTLRFPVELVSWDQAAEFCLKLTAQERQAGGLPEGWQYRLPTEAQREYACRAGTRTATAFGDKLSSREANFYGYSPYNGAERGRNLGRTTAVGSYAANSWGLHDLHGNVWEWCRDCYKEKLPGGLDPDVTEMTVGGKHERHDYTNRVLRGGSYDSYGRGCRSAKREWNTPGCFSWSYGFRLVAVQTSR